MLLWIFVFIVTGFKMSNDSRYHIETASEKYRRKFAENPFLTGGVIGLIGAVAYGAYAYRHRGSMSTSIFLMQLRVSAQGMVVGALGLGMLWETGKLLYRQSQEPSD